MQCTKVLTHFCYTYMQLLHASLNIVSPTACFQTTNSRQLDQSFQNSFCISWKNTLIHVVTTTVHTISVQNITICCSKCINIWFSNQIYIAMWSVNRLYAVDANWRHTHISHETLLMPNGVTDMAQCYHSPGRIATSFLSGL